VILAQSVKGVESTRLPQPSSTTTSGSTLGTSPAQTSSSTSRTTNNTPAIIGGVVGGVVAIGLIAALIIFLMLRSRQKTQKYNSSFQLTNPSIIHTASPPPGSPGRTYVSWYCVDLIAKLISFRTLMMMTGVLIPT